MNVTTSVVNAEFAKSYNAHDQIARRREAWAGRLDSYGDAARQIIRCSVRERVRAATGRRTARDRKSTRLNSSHVKISYAVFCLKKKNDNDNSTPTHACRLNT